MPRGNKIIAAIVILLSVLNACKKQDLEVNTFGIRHDKTIAQYETVATNVSPYHTSEYPEFSSVVSFSYSLDGSQSGDYTATGTLVSPVWILTAGHNFYVAEEQSSPAPVSGINVLLGDDPNNPQSTYQVSEVVYHPTWINENEDFLKANDMALVRLSSPITDVAPANINFEDLETLGNTVWYCGFGDYTNGGQSLSKKHAIENVLDRKNDGIVSSVNGQTYTGGLLAFDFDSPFEDANTLGDGTINDDEAVLGDGNSSAAPTEFEGATVQGDSGGPIFMKINGGWKVCGVLSGGANNPVKGHRESDYGDISVFIRTATHKDWIESVIN